MHLILIIKDFTPAHKKHQLLNLFKEKWKIYLTTTMSLAA